MSDREEREEHIKRLEASLACEEKQFSGKCLKEACDDNCALLYEQGNWGEWKDTLRYAINSLKTDLKYDLLYEETIEQSDKQADKPTTKNDLGVDLISREQAKTAIRDKFKDLPSRVEINTILNGLPSVTPQEPQSFIWCTDCKEYDQEKHCCHRYSKVIRDAVAEIRQEPKTGHWIANAPQYDMLNPQYICSECGNAHTRTTPYCEMCGAKMIEPQESEG